MSVLAAETLAEQEFASTQKAVVVLEGLSLADRLAALDERRSNPPRRVRNSLLYAGWPMYYYCRSCSYLAIVMPEAHTEEVPKLCLECEALEKLGALSST